MFCMCVCGCKWLVHTCSVQRSTCGSQFSFSLYGYLGKGYVGVFGFFVLETWSLALADLELAV